MWQTKGHPSPSPTFGGEHRAVDYGTEWASYYPGVQHQVVCTTVPYGKNLFDELPTVV